MPATGGPGGTGGAFPTQQELTQRYGGQWSPMQGGGFSRAAEEFEGFGGGGGTPTGVATGGGTANGAPTISGGPASQPVGPAPATGADSGFEMGPNTAPVDPNWNTGGTYNPQGPGGPVYAGFDEAGFQDQGKFGTARSEPWSAPPGAAPPVPPQPPPEDGPAGPPGGGGGGQEWFGGKGLYGGIWSAMSGDQQQQYNQIQQQDPNLQPMARGGDQSNVARRQAMWSILNQDNTYSNAPTDWGNFGGSNWQGYGG